MKLESSIGREEKRERRGQERRRRGGNRLSTLVCLAYAFHGDGQQVTELYWVAGLGDEGQVKRGGDDMATR